ncbi:hypothetical protein BC826DRAFT_1103155 [Russula brevipes]|nr:hypothetical protein BC826DRAFT_1103155 [Russula brevipes]
MSEEDPSVNRLAPSSSGLTLVLPSLKALKQLNAKKKNSPLLEPTPVKKAPRPVKLKPLKEVLTSLITKIKKKDDYAFFLEPVNPEKVPGYMDVIGRPMDFGTMTEKVAKSKYRTLDEFVDDFRLVISNTKTFNPPGTIYYTEAERIDAWASDHLAKAASCVIEYETDWNIEIQHDEDVNVDADEDPAAGRASAGPDTPARRSQSVVSASVLPPNRRGKNAAKKEGISETLEPDGHLPGYKDGVGVFPPGSDWAEVMLALKLKGKRYRSKKERLRMEKGGPPYATDGSLDYAENSSHTNLPLPVNVPPPESPPVTPAPGSQATGSGKSKYHHWAITRPAPQRGKAKDQVEEQPPPPEWRKPRPPHAADFGLFPSFATSRSPGGTLEVLATQERLFGALYTSLENAVRSPASASQATAAQSWLQEVVYGGIDGLAYMRSVAEFVTPVAPANANPEHAGGGQGGNAALAGYVDAVLVNELTEHRHRAVEAALTELGASGQQNSPGTTSHPPPLPPPPPPFPELPTQLDLGSLISAPNELFDAEKAWAGAGAKEDAAVLSRALDHASRLLEELRAERMGAAGAVGKMDVDGALEEEEEEEEEEEGEEGAGRDLETELRMNLIALAKRAPLDQIARMPPELVPPHLRRVVPTIGC